MASPDRSWFLVALGVIAAVILAFALGIVVTLWAVDQPVPTVPAKPAAPPRASEPPPVSAATPPTAAPAPPPAAAPAPPAAETPAAPAAAPAPGPPPLAPAPEAPRPPATPPATAVAPPPPVDADALAAKLPYAVQLGAFAELERAQHLARVLEAQGYPAEVEDRDSQKGHEMHYVRLADGYDSMAAASKAAAALKRKLDIDAIPVRRGGAGSDR